MNDLTTDQLQQMFLEFLEQDYLTDIEKRDLIEYALEQGGIDDYIVTAMVIAQNQKVEKLQYRVDDLNAQLSLFEVLEAAEKNPETSLRVKVVETAVELIDEEVSSFKVSYYAQQDKKAKNIEGEQHKQELELAKSLKQLS